MKKPSYILDSLKSFLWDVDISEIDIEKNKNYVIERILEYGDVPEVEWLLSNFECLRKSYTQKQNRF